MHWSKAVGARGKIVFFSLNAKSRVQVCAPTCTGEFAPLTACADDQSANHRLCFAWLNHTQFATIAVVGAIALYRANFPKARFWGAGTGAALQRFADYTVMWSPGRQLHDIGDGEDLSDFDE